MKNANNAVQLMGETAGVDPQVHVDRMLKEVLASQVRLEVNSEEKVALSALAPDAFGLVVTGELKPERLSGGMLLLTTVCKDAMRAADNEAKRFAYEFAGSYGIPRPSIEPWQGPFCLDDKGKLVVPGSKTPAVYFAYRFKVRGGI